MSNAMTYSPEVRERAVRMVFEHQKDHTWQWATIASIAGKIGCTAQTLCNWVRQAERVHAARANALWVSVLRTCRPGRGL